MTFPGLRKFIAERSKTRVLAFLNIACHGMAGAGCSGTDFGPGITVIYFAQLELVGVSMVIRLRNDFQPYHWTS